MEFIAAGRQLLKEERLALAEDVLQWAEGQQETDRSTYYHAVFARGLMYFHSELFDKALETTMQARQMFTDDADEDALAQTSATIGSIYRAMGEIELAIRYLMEAIGHFENGVEDGFIYIAACYNLGEIFADGGRYTEALAQYDKMLAKRGIHMFDTLINLAYNGIGNIYLKKKEFEKALGYLEQGLAESEKIGNQANMARLHTSLGMYYQQTGNTSRALEEQRQALNIRKGLHIDGGSVTNLLDIAGIHMQTGNLP